MKTHLGEVFKGATQLLSPHASHKVFANFKTCDSINEIISKDSFSLVQKHPPRLVCLNTGVPAGSIALGGPGRDRS